MDLTHPISALAPGLTGAVLEVLARATHPLTGRAVQRLVSRPASQAGVQKALDRLADTGLVSQTGAGRALLHRLNRAHVLAPAVLEVVAMNETIPIRIAEAVRIHAPGASSALLFGSVARREAAPHSDIDLLVVWPDTTEESTRWSAAADIAVAVARLTGNPCTPLVYTEDEYAGLPERAPAFAASLDRDSIDLLAYRV
ncbi:MAG: nucleotidyltransferase domain-containing protein [bacterium]|nr:nucleotidyltransferase domain-containing protein [bacterium]MDE0353452.1 nucleotidyltransferase domain-containing protein [bacterium]